MAVTNHHPAMIAVDRQSGFTMIEVLVSIFIIAIGVLGLAGLQARTMVAEIESYERAQALVLMADMVDKINNNRASADCYLINGFLGAAGTGKASPVGNCSLAGLARATGDLAEWDLLLQGDREKIGSVSVGAMIGARGCISGALGGPYTVTVVWQGQVDTFGPTVTCAQGLYGSETKRRAVSTTVRIARLSA